MTRCWTLSGLACLVALSLIAAEARAERPVFEFTPFVGYRMGGQFDVENEETGKTKSVDVSDDMSWGIDLGLYRDDYSYYEFLYSAQSAEFESTELFVRGIDLKTEYYQIGGTVLFPADGSRYEWIVPYLSLTIGATRFKPDGPYDSETNFSGSLGGGLRIPFNERVALNLGLRGYLTFVDSDSAIFCTGSGDLNCLVRTSGSTFFQGEGTLGVSVTF
jgi:hypothetical protein